jgi:hypothetical protein
MSIINYIHNFAGHIVPILHTFVDGIVDRDVIVGDRHWRKWWICFVRGLRLLLDRLG